MPLVGSDVAITIAGVDVTDHVLYPTARFESQLGAVPGDAEVYLKDVDQSLDFTTGDEWTVDIDGTRMWGGFVRLAERGFAFPAVDTTVPANVKTRQWHLTGLDYNVLFDARIIHNDADPYTHLPFFTLDRDMGELLRTELFAKYLDISGDGLDTTTLVDDLFPPNFDSSGNPVADASKTGGWPQQGSRWRAGMDLFAKYGAVYYIRADKKVVFTDVESTVAGWGFSDKPNRLALPTSGATYPMREFTEVENASAMANDAFVWGGSEFAGVAGGTVFARSSNAGSITDHKRWQYAETKFGELRSQGEVKARANVIVSGNTTGAVGGDTARGLAVDQKQAKLAWFGHDVPRIAGVPQHLRASDVVTLVMYVWSENGIDPLVVTLPLRSMKITFPTLKSDGTSYVRFDGFFGVQLDDPWWLWKFLRDFTPPLVQPPQIVSAADGSSTTAIYGAEGSFPFNESPDGSRREFSINFAYVAGTAKVYRNKEFQYPTIDFTESDPGGGKILFASAPDTTDELWMTCTVAGGVN